MPGSSEWTVRRAIANGELAATKRSGAYRISPAALAVYRKRIANHADDEGTSSAPLPDALTSFLGRRREREDILRRLAAGDTRLLTLTGPGGVGKTRLALQAATDIRDEGGEVRFVPLDVIDRPERVLPAIAQAMRLRDTGTRSLVDALAHAWGNRSLLLVLDNVEHVLDAARDIAALLVRCPRLRIFATSRVRLHIDGGHEYPVHPLDYPDPARLRPGAMDAVAACSAVALFVARARAVDPDFALTEDNVAAVVGICARLDGLPLAIELAAARARVLSPAALLGELKRRLPLLTGGSVDRPDRHQTLRDTIAWSYDRLAPGDQAAFRRLAVCQGGFDLDLASAVTGAETHVPSGAAALDLVQRLVEHSLVRPIGGAADRPRFALLETIREFGLEQLLDHGEEDAARRAHAAWALAFARRNELAPYQLAVEATLNALAIEQGNLDVALEWTQGHEPATFVQLVAAIGWLWWVRRYRQVEREWPERASLLREGKTPSDHARIMTVLSFMLMAGGDLSRARACLIEGLTTYRDLGDEAVIAHMLLGLGVVATYQGQYGQATDRFEDALRHARAITDSRWSAALTAAVLRNRSVAARDQGRLSEAEADQFSAYELEQQTGSTLGMLHSLADLGDIARDLGEPARACGFYLQGLRLGRLLGETRVTISVLEGIATVLAD